MAVAFSEESREDYNIGFGGLLPSAGSSKSLALTHSFQFKGSSKYRALKVSDEQYKASESYEAKHKLDVHYLFYNPWTLDTRPSFWRSASNVKAFERRGALPTSHISSMCRSIRCSNVVGSTFARLTGASPRSIRRSVAVVHWRASYGEGTSRSHTIACAGSELASDLMAIV